MNLRTQAISRRALLQRASVTVGALAVTRTLPGFAFDAEDVAASVSGQQVFPPDNPWNTDISAYSVDANSANLIASIGLTTGLHPDFGTVYNGAPNGIPYVVVSGQTPVSVIFTEYGDQSDPGPYPIPPDAPIEGGTGSSGDRHVLVIDRDHGKLYELYHGYPNTDGSWNAGSGAVFDLNSNALRPAGWTSADAAGLPIFPGLVRYDEVVLQGVVNHAFRFTVQNTRAAYVSPARHFASSSTNPNLPPMGMRVRLRGNFDLSGFSPTLQVILTAMKRYGMFVADNGSNWFVSGAPDPRWNDDDLVSGFRRVKGSDFEVVGAPPSAPPIPPLPAIRTTGNIPSTILPPVPLDTSRHIAGSSSSVAIIPPHR